MFHMKHFIQFPLLLKCFCYTVLATRTFAEKTGSFCPLKGLVISIYG